MERGIHVYLESCGDLHMLGEASFLQYIPDHGEQLAIRDLARLADCVNECKGASAGCFSGNLRVSTLLVVFASCKHHHILLTPNTPLFFHVTGVILAVISVGQVKN